MRLVDAAGGGSAPPVFTASGLAKVYRSSWGRRVEALRDLTLDIPRGEIFGLLGPNGAGKTTTLKLLMGFMRPSGGTGRVLGEPLGSLGARARIGFLPENPYFYEYLTPVEFLDTCAALSGVPGHERQDRIRDTLARVGLDPAERRRLRKLSKGTLQRVGLAQAILHDPELVVLDEPMSGLDPLGRRQVRDLLLELRDRGKTVIFSSHILPDVETVCDRVGILVRGKLRRTGRLRDLVQPGRNGFEIEVAELPETLRAAWASSGIARLAGDRYLLSASSGPEVEERLRQVFHAGATLHSVRPVAASLEDIFMEEVRASETGPPPATRGAA
jgi:ABC-2 type transport system ATP-binding protein